MLQLVGERVYLDTLGTQYTSTLLTVDAVPSSLCAMVMTMITVETCHSAFLSMLLKKYASNIAVAVPS
jgi:hypothetical protein